MRAVALALLLAGCGSTAPQVVTVPVAEISAETQAQAADEMAACPQSAALTKIVADWIRMRDQARSLSD